MVSVPWKWVDLMLPAVKEMHHLYEWDTCGPARPSPNLLECYTRFLMQLHRLILDNDIAMFQFFHFNARGRTLFAVSTFLKSEPSGTELYRGLQLWRTSHLWSIHVLCYQTFGGASTRVHKVHRDRLSGTFKGLFMEDYLEPSTILELFQYNTQIADPGLLEHQVAPDWLLVLLAELYRDSRVLTARDTTASEDAQRFERTLHEAQSILLESRADDAQPASDRFKVAGALFLEAWYIVLWRTGVTPDDTSVAIPAVAEWIKAICADNPSRVDILAPRFFAKPGTEDDENDRIQMDFDHETIFRFVYNICENDKVAAVESGLAASTIQLIDKIEVLENTKLRERAELAKKACDALLAMVDPESSRQGIQMSGGEIYGHRETDGEPGVASVAGGNDDSEPSNTRDQGTLHALAGVTDPRWKPFQTADSLGEPQEHVVDFGVIPESKGTETIQQSPYTLPVDTQPGQHQQAPRIVSTERGPDTVAGQQSQSDVAMTPIGESTTHPEVEPRVEEAETEQLFEGEHLVYPGPTGQQSEQKSEDIVVIDSVEGGEPSRCGRAIAKLIGSTLASAQDDKDERARQEAGNEQETEATGSHSHRVGSLRQEDAKGDVVDASVLV